MTANTESTYNAGFCRGKCGPNPATGGSLGMSDIYNYIYYIYEQSNRPQDAHGRLVLHVYLGSNTLEFSAIRRLNLCETKFTAT